MSGLPQMGNMTASGFGQIEIRLSVQQLCAASYFSRKVEEIEKSNAGQLFGEFYDEILWNATACVFTATASLEAYANEFYVDRAVNFPDLSEDVAIRFWELFEQKPILEKFELALLLRKTPSSTLKSDSSFDHARALVALRNALTHFKPEWKSETDSHAKLSRQLAGRFTSSPFFQGAGQLFPIRWATHDCTVWAVKTVLNFAKKFEDSGGLQHKYTPYLARLVP